MRNFIRGIGFELYGGLLGLFLEYNINAENKEIYSRKRL